MAIDNADLEKLLETLVDKLTSANSRFGGLDKSIESVRKSMEALQRGEQGIIDQDLLIKKAAIDYTKTVKEATNAQKQKRLSDVEANIAIQDAKLKIETLKDQFPELGVKIEEQIAQLEKSEAAQEKEVAVRLRNAKIIDTSSKVLSGLGTVVSGIISGYQGAGSEIAQGGALLQTTLGVVGSASSQVGQGLTSVGQAASKTASTMTGSYGTALKVAGGLAQGAGIALGIFGKGAEALSKVMPVLTNELNMVYGAFGKINAVGATFAGGITEMQSAAKDVNLTLPEFADVLQSSAEQLTASGGGIIQAAKQMGQVGMVMRQTGIAQGLRNLGIEYKDQAGLIADTMANFAATNRLRGASEEELAKSTGDYASNLKVLSGITGEDARKAQERNRRAAFDADVYAKLQKMGPDAVAKFQAQLEIFQKADPSGKLAEAFKQQFAGVTNSTDPAIRSLMQLPGAADAFKGAIDAINNPANDLATTTRGAVGSVENLRKVFSDNVDKLVPLSAAARAGVGGIVGDINTVFGNVVSQTGLTVEAFDKQTDALTKAKAGTDPVTASMNQAADSVRQMNLAIQTEFLQSGVLTKFADGIKTATSDIASAISAISGKKPNSQDSDTLFGKITNWLGTPGNLSGALTGAGMVTQGVGIAADVTGVGATAGIPLNIIGGVLEGLGGLAGMLGFASGGISSGPSSGYLAKLHGTEAVLPENLTSMLTEMADSYANNPQSAAVDATLLNNTAMSSDNTKYAEASANFLETLNRKMDLLISATNEVVRHTKDTSVRIA